VSQQAAAVDHVLIPRAAELTGYTPRAIKEKIAKGVWLEGREYVRAPDGHLMVSLKGYEQWVAQGKA
jgi:hypothetical protein